MTWETVTYKREELYERVWSEPMRKLAKQYGVSDVALAKTCRKLRIPLPGVGYWAKVAAGRKLKRPPLPPLKEGEPAEYTVTRHGKLNVASPGAGDQPSDSAPPITVPDILDSPHKLVRRSLKRLRRTARAWRKIEPTREWCLDIRTTTETLDRALRIVDTLVKSLEARGYPVEVTDPKVHDEDTQYRYSRPESVPSRTRVRIRDEWVEFGIDEAYDSIEIPPPPPSKRQSSYASSYWTPRPEREQRANGKLILRMRNAPYGSGHRVSWGDGKTRRLETILNDFVGGLETMAGVFVAERIERERYRQEQREAGEQREKERQRREREAQLVYDLNDRINDWDTARSIREFVAAVQADAGERTDGIDPDSDLGRWISWASARAEALSAAALGTILQLRVSPDQRRYF